MNKTTSAKTVKAENVTVAAKRGRKPVTLNDRLAMAKDGKLTDPQADFFEFLTGHGVDITRQAFAAVVRLAPAWQASPEHADAVKARKAAVEADKVKAAQDKADKAKADAAAKRAALDALAAELGVTIA